jgi:small subunit ribosomal protein S15
MAESQAATKKQINILPERKAKIVSKYKINDKDCGSSEVQIALLTDKLELLSEHFKTNPKDVHSQRGMMRAISRRKKMLAYLKSESPDRYKALISSLGLRK